MHHQRLRRETAENTLEEICARAFIRHLSKRRKAVLERLAVHQREICQESMVSFSFSLSNVENFEYLEKAPSYDEVMEASDLPKKVDPTKVTATQSTRPKRSEAERQARRQQRRRVEGSGQRRSTDGGRRHGRSNRCVF